MDTLDATPTVLDVTIIAVAVVLFALAALGPIVSIAVWILAPLDRAAKSRKAPARFSLGDFLCLFVLIQLPLTAVFRLRDLDNKSTLWIAATIVSVLGTAIWAKGARTLSRAGVANGSHRFVFLGIILPVAYYGLLPYMFISCFGLHVILFGIPDFRGDDLGMALLSVGVATYFCIWLALTIAYLASAKYTRWMLKQATPAENINDDLTVEETGSAVRASSA